MNVEEQAERAVAAVVDSLLAAARTLNGLEATTHAEGLAIEGARLALRRIADPELRDLARNAVPR